MLASHPAIKPSAAGHVAHAERYRAANGANIGLEPRGGSHLNIFVERHAVRVARLHDIPHQLYLAAHFQDTKPNHDLFHREAFGEVDIARFKVTTLWQAARIIVEVAGMGAP